jgi:apolipoprotein D and lipocalin family protein
MTQKRQHLRKGLLASLVLLLAGCQTEPLAPIATARKVDLPRFMGDWYVIANIPTYFEKDAHNPVESYRLAADGTIETTFTFRDGGFDGQQKTYRPRGFVVDRATNAVWGMQFIWPVKAEYRILHVSDDYRETIIGRTKRDYVWIMARTPQISDNDFQRLMKIIADQGYDIAKVRKAPQQER